MLTLPLGHNHISEPLIQWVLSLSHSNQHTQKPKEGPGRQVVWGLTWVRGLVGSSVDRFWKVYAKLIPTLAHSWLMCILPSHQKRVFETVRNINQVVKQRSLTPSPMNIPGSNQSSAMNSLLSSCVSTPRSSFYGSDVGNVVLDNKTNSIILEAESDNLG